MATTTRHATVWPVLSYRNARAAIDFLAEAFWSFGTYAGE